MDGKEYTDKYSSSEPIADKVQCSNQGITDAIYQAQLSAMGSKIFLDGEKLLEALNGRHQKEPAKEEQ